MAAHGELFRPAEHDGLVAGGWELSIPTHNPENGLPITDEIELRRSL